MAGAAFTPYHDPKYAGRLEVHDDTGAKITLLFERDKPSAPGALLSPEAIELLPPEIASIWRG